MEDPFPYRPLEKPDGWVEVFNQPATLDDGNHGPARAWSMSATAFVCVVLIAATGWVYSIWLTLVALPVAMLILISSCDYGERWSPFETSIVEQLEKRPERYRWPNADDRRQQIVECVVKAVADEKPISDPRYRALHPGDPVELLFWGPFDDWSPLIFQFEFDQKFGLKKQSAFPRDLLFDAADNGESLLEFVERCECYLESIGIDVAVEPGVDVEVEPKLSNTTCRKIIKADALTLAVILCSILTIVLAAVLRS